MRLIDIDEHFESNKVFYDADIKMPLHRVKTVLENTPTVKAIPVEYIKKKLDKLKDDIKWSWYYGNAAVKEMEWAETWVQIVLLEEWEKENGKENN